MVAGLCFRFGCHLSTPVPPLGRARVAHLRPTHRAPLHADQPRLAGNDNQVTITTQAARHASAGISKALRRRLPLPAGSGRLVWAAAAAQVGVLLVRRLAAKPAGLVASNPRWVKNPRHAKG